MSIFKNLDAVLESDVGKMMIAGNNLAFEVTRKNQDANRVEAAKQVFVSTAQTFSKNKVTRQDQKSQVADTAFNIEKRAVTFMDEIIAKIKKWIGNLKTWIVKNPMMALAAIAVIVIMWYILV